MGTQKQEKDKIMRRSSPWSAHCSNCSSSEKSEKLDSRKDFLELEALKQGRQLVASESGYGYIHETSICPEGVPVEFALLLLLAAFGVAFGVLYRALTLTTGKRSAGYLVFDSPLADLFWSGQTLEIILSWKTEAFRCTVKILVMSQRKISSNQKLESHEPADVKPIWSAGQPSDGCKVPSCSSIPSQCPKIVRPSVEPVSDVRQLQRWRWLRSQWWGQPWRILLLHRHLPRPHPCPHHCCRSSGSPCLLPPDCGCREEEKVTGGQTFVSSSASSFEGVWLR